MLRLRLLWHHLESSTRLIQPPRLLVPLPQPPALQALPNGLVPLPQPALQALPNGPEYKKYMESHM